MDRIAPALVLTREARCAYTGGYLSFICCGRQDSNSYSRRHFGPLPDISALPRPMPDGN
jgi:hypothetical protein